MSKFSKWHMRKSLGISAWFRIAFVHTFHQYTYTDSQGDTAKTSTPALVVNSKRMHQEEERETYYRIVIILVAKKRKEVTLCVQKIKGNTDTQYIVR